MGRTTNKSARTAELARAREKAAAARVAQQRAEQRRRATAIIASVVAVALVVAGVAYYAINRTPSSSASAAKPASPALVSQVTGVSLPTAAAVGAGQASGPPATINGTVLGSASKPTLLFIGAEFCPYCAAQRWAMVNALSRFGTFSGLQTIRSSEDDIPTFTFLKSHYSSKYLTFDSKEQEDQNHKPLQPLTKLEQKQWQTYPEPGSSSVGFPFMDLNGKYVFTTPMVDPTLLQGKTWNQVAAAMSTPGSSSLGKAEMGAANLITSAICRQTNGKPANVCTPAIMNLTANSAAYKS